MRRAGRDRFMTGVRYAGEFIVGAGLFVVAVFGLILGILETAITGLYGVLRPNNGWHLHRPDREEWAPVAKREVKVAPSPPHHV